MEQHFQLSDTEFEYQFDRCILSPTYFTHEAHLRLAWIMIKKYGMERAEKRIQIKLLQFVEAAGARDKYNTTLTLAAMKAVHHFMLKLNVNSFSDFINEFPRLKYNFKELMACHYGFDIYNSKKAKDHYLKPDLLPFD